MQYKLDIYNYNQSSNYKKIYDESKNFALNLHKDINNPEYDCLNIVNRINDYDNLELFINKWKFQFTDVFIIGTGGSNLAASAITSIKRNFRDACKPHFIDNLNSESFIDKIKGFNLEKVGFVIISKSGKTVEVVSLTIILLNYLESKIGLDNLSSKVVCITSKSESIMRDIMVEKKISIIEHKENISGRFSVFTEVSALPCMLAGINFSLVLKGARDVLQNFFKNESSVLKSTVFIKNLIDSGYSSNILVFYNPRLYYFGQWHRQLWTESLCKDGKGMVTAPSICPVDQHSQLQMWLDGPNNQVINIFLIDSINQGDLINSKNFKGAEIFDGLRTGDIIDILGKSTVNSLISSERPVRIFKINLLDENTLGALFMHFCLETIICSNLLGVNPFDQIAVDTVKKRVMNEIKITQEKL
ncbi:hypothetical protein OAK17_02735 [Alphaproteobacteria bacterium]|nr:hypothetical protein [Alphaproteobacteria bacterium]